jgi:hypothetical protein
MISQQQVRQTIRVVADNGRLFLCMDVGDLLSPPFDYPAD